MPRLRRACWPGELRVPASIAAACGASVPSRGEAPTVIALRDSTRQRAAPWSGRARCQFGARGKYDVAFPRANVCRTRPAPACCRAWLFAQHANDQSVAIDAQRSSGDCVRTCCNVADAGYSNGEHLDACERQGITATVPRRIIPGSRAEFQKSHFTYEAEHDHYRCPAGEILRRSRMDMRRKLYVYRRSGCSRCSLQKRCTTSDTRMVTRHLYEAAYERSTARLRADPTLMNRRMGIAERPFAVIKHLMGLRRFSCRGLGATRTEMAIAVLAYTLKQIISNLGVQKLLALMA